MEKNNVLLISNNNSVTKALKEKLVLLRKSDELFVVNDEEFCECIEELNPSLIFLAESEDRDLTVQTLSLISAQYKDALVILFSIKKDYDFILSLYDKGVYDCIFMDTPPAEVLIKSINAFKKVNLLKVGARDKELLASANFVSRNSGFYTEECANELMLTTLDGLDVSSDSFMIIACDELDRAHFKIEPLVKAISESIRANDFVIELKSGKFYLYLRDTDEEGAVSVFTKIREKLEVQFRIKAGIVAVTGRSFRDLEQKASVSLTDAMLGASEYIVFKDRVIAQGDEWTLDTDEKQQDFKLFKQLFVKKLNKVVTPVFYRLQMAYQGLLGETKIEQYAHETQCIFHLKHPNQTSRLTIVYPGFAKVVIYITHSGWDSPDNKELFLPLKQLTESNLSQIVEEFIEDFKNCIKE